MAETDRIPDDPMISGEASNLSEIKPPQRRTRQTAPKPAPEAQHADPNAVTRALHAIFKLAARITRSDTDFAESEFKNISSGLVDLSKRVAPVGIILVALTPAVIVVELIDKVMKLRQGIKPKDPNGVPDGYTRPFPENTEPHG